VVVGFGLKLLDAVERVMRKLAPGPSPSFNEAHVIKVLEIIGDKGSLGRIRLSNALGLGEGTTRTLLRHLKSAGVIEGSRRGISLSEKGKALFSDLRSKLSEEVEVPSSRLTVGPFNVAILVKGSAQAVKSGMEQRDVAIKSGASGATTLVFSNKKLAMPTREDDISVSMPSLHKQLLTKFKPKENDVIIVGSGENRELAEIGAKMAALKLLKNTS
jgi:predicted transcriptional regulator